MVQNIKSSNTKSKTFPTIEATLKKGNIFFIFGNELPLQLKAPPPSTPSKTTNLILS